MAMSGATMPCGKPSKDNRTEETSKELSAFVDLQAHRGHAGL